MEQILNDANSKLISNRRFRFRFMRHDGWENALFVHWPVAPKVLSAQLPQGLEPDLLDGSAWIGLVLLTERGVSATPAAGRSFLPHIDHFGANIRTYVRRNGVPGIFFFSLECSSFFASLGARLAGIPYFPARMSRTVDIEYPLMMDSGTTPDALGGSGCLSTEADQKVPSGSTDFVFKFASKRWRGPAVSASWRLQCASGSANDMQDSSLVRARWFVERYSVYTAWPVGRGPLLLRGDVQHPPWPLQSAFLDELDAGQLLAAAGFAEMAEAATLYGSGDSNVAAPHVCFSRGVGPVDFWMLEPV